MVPSGCCQGIGTSNHAIVNAPLPSRKSEANIQNALKTVPLLVACRPQTPSTTFRVPSRAFFAHQKNVKSGDGIEAEMKMTDATLRRGTPTHSLHDKLHYHRLPAARKLRSSEVYLLLP